MRSELKIPEVGESITEVEIGGWLKGKGDRVQKDDPLVTLESEKATVELPAPDAGVIAEILKQKGGVAKVGEVIGYLETDDHRAAAPKWADPQPAERLGELKPERPVELAQPTPAPRRTGFQPVSDLAPAKPAEAPAAPEPQPKAPSLPDREEEIVPMSRLRRTAAERLVQAQRTAALLTTFNEADMSSVISLRKDYGEVFQQKYKVKLGFMSFFVKGCIDALKQFPALNGQVRGTDIVYHNFYDIGVAIGSGKGLVVPVLRNAERMSFAEIEMAIADFARRAKENKLKVEELQGGTFTVSNGGVYGSLLSTPIVNPPQCGVLGLHAIQERPVARDGNVVIRPMMYLALTYDHRIVDGREAVSFLKRIKEDMESPARMLMEV